MSKFIADINERLFYYVSTGDLDNVIKLLLEGASATKKSSCGRTALGQAALKGHTEVLEVLLQSCEEGDTVFNSRTVARCTDMEIDYTPDGMDNLEWDDEIDSDYCTTSETDECSSLYLYYAKTFEQTGAILLNNNYGPNKREDPHTLDALSRAPIHYAAAYGHIDCLNLLLQHKSPVDMTTAKGITPLHLAVNNEEIVRLLLSHRANPNRKTFTTGETALHIAIRQGNLQVVELLLQSGAYINETNNREYTPLMCAIELDADEIAFSLVSKGAKLNLEDCNGHTALYLAVARNKVNLAGYLLEHGARLLISHYLLHKCVKHDYREMARLLLAHGAGDNLNVRDLAGCTAVFLAIFSCNADMLEVLLENANRRGQTIDRNSNELYYAVQYAESVQRFGRVARVLLAHGVPLNSRASSCCQTPLTRAITLKKLDIAEFLIKEGADVSLICTEHVADTLRVALRTSYLNLLILLVHAGLNISLFQPVTRHKPHWNAIRKDLESWIACQCRNPLSLQSLSRIQVRKRLIQNLDKQQIAKTNNHNESRLHALIRQTGIPIPLQKYLSDFDDLPRV